MEPTWEIVKAIGPSGLVAVALVYLAREYKLLNDRYQALQEQRVKDSQSNTQAMLAVAERVHVALDRIEELTERRR